MRAGVAEEPKRKHRDRRPGGLGLRCLRPVGGQAGRGGARCVDCHCRRYEAESLAMRGPDVTLGRPVVPERLARGLDAARDCGIRDDAAVPHFLEQLVAGHQPVPVLDEVNQEREDLGLQRARRSARAQFGSRQVELELAEPVDHGGEHRRRPLQFPRSLHGITRNSPCISGLRLSGWQPCEPGARTLKEAVT